MTTRRRNTKTRTCRFWNCPKRVRGSHDYCYEHYQAYLKDEIDDCPGCGLAKSAKYRTCLDCRPTESSRSEKPKKTYRREHSDAWKAGDSEADEFYVYILKIDDGSFYAGQTREIRERLMEHRDGTTKSTAGRNPKLVWFSTVSTREQATGLEVQLKKLCDRNPREIRRWVRRFQDLVEELDFS